MSSVLLDLLELPLQPPKPRLHGTMVFAVKLIGRDREGSGLGVLRYVANASHWTFTYQSSMLNMQSSLDIRAKSQTHRVRWDALQHNLPMSRGSCSLKESTGSKLEIN